MTDQQTVTVAGVHVTVQAADGALTVTIGRIDPAAASALLHVHPRFGTASVGVYIADETSDTAHRPDHRWFSDLHPGPPGATESIHLRDGCVTAATSLLAECTTAARKSPTTRACACASPDECQWCGTPGRLHEVSRADVRHLLPTVSEEHEGQWFLHFADGRRGPYLSAQAAGDDWHASTGPALPHHPCPRTSPARANARRTPDRSSGRSRIGHDRP